jgi:hypothetical protein
MLSRSESAFKPKIERPRLLSYGVSLFVENFITTFSNAKSSNCVHNNDLPRASRGHKPPGDSSVSWAGITAIVESNYDFDRSMGSRGVSNAHEVQIELKIKNTFTKFSDPSQNANSSFSLQDHPPSQHHHHGTHHPPASVLSIFQQQYNHVSTSATH